MILWWCKHPHLSSTRPIFAVTHLPFLPPEQLLNKKWAEMEVCFFTLATIKCLICWIIEFFWMPSVSFLQWLWASFRALLHTDTCLKLTSNAYHKRVRRFLVHHKFPHINFDKSIIHESQCWCSLAHVSNIITSTTVVGFLAAPEASKELNLKSASKVILKWPWCVSRH